MNLTDASLQRVDTHWAVLAVGEAERDRALAVCGARLVKRAVGSQIRIEFPEHGRDEDLLSRLAMAYEIAAIEGINAFLSLDAEKAALREQCAAGAWRAFEIGRLFDLPRMSTIGSFMCWASVGIGYCATDGRTYGAGVTRTRRQHRWRRMVGLAGITDCSTGSSIAGSAHTEI